MVCAWVAPTGQNCRFRPGLTCKSGDPLTRGCKKDACLRFKSDTRTIRQMPQIIIPGRWRVPKTVTSSVKIKTQTHVVFRVGPSPCLFAGRADGHGWTPRSGGARKKAPVNRLGELIREKGDRVEPGAFGQGRGGIVLGGVVSGCGEVASFGVEPYTNFRDTTFAGVVNVSLPDTRCSDPPQEEGALPSGETRQSALLQGDGCRGDF